MLYRIASAAFAIALALACHDSTAAADKPVPGTATARPASAVPAKASTAASATATAPAAKPKLVDINSASVAELKTLPGIGDKQASRIIAGRPYLSKAKLAADKILSETEYFALKGRIVAVQKEPSRPKTAKPAAGSKS
jgi:DNA uptake protein ComE-like DNA-binding protein